jgi:hypothetical protein
MKFEIAPSHVAVLVPSVRKAADYLGDFKYEIGEEESFEETKEIYVQGSERNSLLLMEPKGPGSYQRALKKRGPGLHHLAIDVLDIEGFLESLSGSGWLLHLNSLKAIKNLRTAYLARPGFPALIEVHEKKKLMNGPDFVEKISIALDSGSVALARLIGIGHILQSSTGDSSFIAHGKEIALKSLF